MRMDFVKLHEDHQVAMKSAMEHLDSLGVPSESIIRGIVDIGLAANANPMLGYFIERCWPSKETLIQ